MPETFFIIIFVVVCITISVGVWIFLMWTDSRDTKRNHIAIWDKMMSLEIKSDDIIVELRHIKERFKAMEADILDNYKDIQEVRRRLGM